MENVRDVASWFLSQESMTHKKVQKLCYYAQAWYCALYGEGPLFDDEIQAWVHGPVIPSLYPVYADYKWNSIPRQAFDEHKLAEKSLQVLNAVYNTYGSFSGDQLESLTHNEAPWKNARGNRKPWETCTESIPCDVMKEYYGKMYEQSQGE